MTIVRTLLCAAVLLASASAVHAEEGAITLQDAYNAALRTNEAVKISQEDLFQAESRVDQALTYLYPRVNANSSYTRYHEVLPPDSTTVFQPKDEMRASLVLNQPLYTGGRTFAALRMAKTMRETSAHELAVTQQDILMNVTEAYYSVLKAQQLVEISRSSLQRMERHKMVTEREAATRRTKANRSALLRANTLVSQAQIMLTRAEDGVKIAREKLGLLTRLPADAAIAEPEAASPPQGNLSALQEAALSSRDDYASARLNQDIARENVTIVKGGHAPQLFAEASLKYLDSAPKTILDGTTYYGGIRLTIPLFEGGLSKAETAEALSKQRQAELAHRWLKQRIESDVQEAYVNLQTMTSVMDMAKLQLEYAKENFDTVEELFAEGLAPSLSLIDAQQALFMAEREHISALFEKQVAVHRLRNSLGLLGKDVRASSKRE